MKKIARGRERGRKKSVRMLSVMLCFCLLITACPYMPGAVVVHAVGEPENGRDAVIQAWLERIAALPDAEQYLAKEPETEEEEAYAQWLKGLYQYEGEALDIQEAYEALTEEQQAQMPAEAFTKLAAWAEIAEQIAGNDRVMLADGAVTATPGAISSDQTWGAQTLTPGTYTINAGVTVTVTGPLTIQGTVTINGGGTLKRDFTTGSSSTGSIIYVAGGELTLNDVTIEGNNIDAQGPAIYIASGTLNMQSGSVIQNNKNMNISTSSSYTAGGIYCNGTLNIDGGVIQNCCTNTEASGSSAYSNAGGAIYLRKTCTMTAGSITGNKASNGGGIYLISSSASLNLLGGTISGNSATKNGPGIYYSTLQGATSELVISGDADVQDVIYLDIKSGNRYPYITSSLNHNITLDSSEGDAGRVLLGGKDYTLTTEDAKKVSMQNSSLYSRLDSEKNQIYLSKDACEHGEMHKTSAKEATCLASGNEEYYTCLVCEGLFSDSIGRIPTTLENVTITQKSHSYTYTASDAVITEKCENGCGHSATATLTLSATSSTYTGQPFEPASIDTDGTWMGTAPTIEYEDNTDVGTATAKMTIEGQTASASCNFTITSATLTGVTVAVESGPHYYTGSGVTPTVEVKDGDTTLEKDTDYTVSYSSNINVGSSAKVTITGTGNYTGTVTKNFTIDAAASSVSQKPTAKTPTYNGTAQELVTAGKASGGTMHYSLDNLTFSTDIPKGTNAGKYTIYYKVVGDGNHNNSAVGTVEVSIGKVTPKVTAPTAKTLTYTGSVQALVNAGSTTGGTLQYSTDGTNYQESIPTGTNRGTYTVYYKVVGNNNYNGVDEKSVSVTIAPKDLTADMITVAAGPHHYTGSAIEPDLTVTDGEKTLVKDTDYTISYLDNTKVGTATVTVTGKSNYVGTVKQTFEIVLSEAGKVANAKTVVEKVLEEITAANGTTKAELQNTIDTALSKAGITDVTATVGNLTKTEATTGEAGSLSVKVSITSENDSSVNDTVTVSKTIPQLLLSEDEKVAAAKTVMENALAGITAINDTTKGDIQSVINEALTKAGISDVTVTVGELTKTEASESDTGSIIGSIEIVSKNDSKVKDSVAINKTIAKLPVHAHVYKWVITKEPTPEELGEMTGICTCGEVITEAIPKTGESGTVIVEEDAQNECKGALADKEDVKGKVTLTDEEKEELKEGTDLVIILRLKDVHLTADTKEKTEIRDELGTNTLGTFLNIELLKQIGGIKTPITETTDEIEITFEVPEHIRNTDSNVNRTYQIMRNHDGVVETLDAESYDEATHLLTFRTDKFSTYAICYKDSQKQGEPGTPTPTPTPGTPTPTPGGAAEPKMPSKEEQTKNELTLNANIKVSQSGRKIKVSWGRISGADGYDVYVQYCGKKFTKKSITAIKSGKTTKVTVKKVNGKPLNLKKNYKMYVLAYKLADGKKITLGKTITAHIVGRMNTKYTNVKAVKVKKSTYSLKKGKTAQIKAKTVLVSKSKKQLSNAHAKQFRYATTNKKVATVSKKGKIKAVGKGSCSIYVYARNGYAKKIKVTVK